MVAHEQRKQFGCILAASLIVLVLNGCGDASESGSSQRAQPSKKIQSTEPGESHAAAGEPAYCNPTQPDMLGPFYEPGAPVRTSVGSRYVLSGRVLAAAECKSIRKARIEFWLANPRGDYDDAHRATVFAGQRGEQRARLLRRQATPHPRSGDSAWLRGAGYATLPPAWPEEGELRSSPPSGVRTV
jgi:hypothetical protein